MKLEMDSLTARKVLGFHYDFIRHRGTCLVLTRDSGLRLHELDPIERRVLETNDIPGLLPIEVEETDLKAALRYNITGRRMLSQWIRTERVPLQQYFRFLHRLSSMLDSCPVYMLREQGFWLHEDFIFIVDDLEAPLCLYIPVLSPTERIPVHEQFKQLAVKLSGAIAAIDGAGFPSLMALLHRERYEFREVKQLLSDLLQNDSIQSAAMDNEAALRHHSPGWVTPFEDKADDERDEAAAQSWSDRDNRLPDSRPDAASKRHIWLGAAIGSIIILLWSFYPDHDHSNGGILYIWSGLTVLLLDIVLIGTKLVPESGLNAKWRSAVRSYEEMEERDTSGLTGMIRVPAPFPANQKESTNVLPSQTIAAPLTGATVLLHPRLPVNPDGSAMPNDEPQRRFPELEVHANGTTTSVQIAKDRFVIGRDPTASDFSDETAGVSKLHAEIVRDFASWHLVDLGSKNGTVRNEEPMVPYKPYPLLDGDSFQIVNTRFVFRTERKHG